MGIIDGKMVASQIKENIINEFKTLKHKTGKTPGLGVILVGDDPASYVYVRNKNKCRGTRKELHGGSMETSR